jgi:hypothetical protein
MSERKRKVDPLATPAPDGAQQVRSKRKQEQFPRRRWTADDDAFIRRHCESMTDAEMATALRHSGVGLVGRRLQVLQLRKRMPLPIW